MTSSAKPIFAWLFLAMMIVGLSACGDTWDGLKSDTADNAEKAGEAIEDTGEAIQDAVN